MPPLVLMLLIFVASTDLGSAEHTSRFIVPFLRWLAPDISFAAIALVQFLVRKAAHLTEYAILGALLFRAFTNPHGRPRWHYAAVALVVAAGYAVFDEFHQTFVQSRTGSARDVLIDITGAALGLLVWWMIARWRAPRLPPATAAV